MESDRETLLCGLQRAGCVHLDAPETATEWESTSPYVSHPESRAGDVRDDLQTLKLALDVLSHHGALKRSFLEPKRGVKQKEILDISALQNSIRDAKDILEQNRIEQSLYAEEGKIGNSIAALIPWKTLDVPLDIADTNSLHFLFGMVPNATPVSAVEDKIEELQLLGEVLRAGENQDGQYFLALIHPSQEEDLLSALKELHFTRIQFRDVIGTAAQNIASLEEQKQKIITQREHIASILKASGDQQNVLELAYDQIAVILAREESVEKLVVTDTTFSLTGWVPDSATSLLERALKSYDCDISFEEPGRDEDVPVFLKDPGVISPFNMVTEMYALPKYNNIDPNPLMAPFFALFFGMMYADMGYGLVLILLGLIVTKKKRPSGSAGNIWKLMIICGATTMLFGAVFGSFFGDLVPTIAKTFFQVEGFWYKPLIDPMENAMGMIILALVLGVVHLLFGMGIKAYLLIRDGKPWDALMDVGSWWVVFAGIAVLALGGTPWVAVAGLVALVCTQGRRAPKFFGKVIGGLGKLYDITSYLSDVLSYLRLMALALASGVIANVFNILAALGGDTPVGVIMFIVVALVGHAFNMAVNIVGTYVHAARLQFLEFFGKFYADGGRAFQPLTIRTKYVDILKEDN
jgi:V/A-type H+-transporting ATPase subunit I